MRTFECPKCGLDISETYHEAEEDVGIGAGWYCDACNEGFGDEDEPEHHDDDVQLFGTGTSLDMSSGTCPYCQTPLEMGYGLAGGGIGPYMFCPASACGKYLIKSQDPG